MPAKKKTRETITYVPRETGPASIQPGEWEDATDLGATAILMGRDVFTVRVWKGWAVAMAGNTFTFTRAGEILIDAERRRVIVPRSALMSDVVVAVARAIMDRREILAVA